MSKQKRFKPEVRKELVLTAALDLAEKTHYLKLTRDGIAKAAGVTGSAIQYHFKTMSQLRGDIMRAAIKQERLIIIAQGLTSDDDRAIKVPDELFRRALAAVAAAGA